MKKKPKTTPARRPHATKKRPYIEIPVALKESPAYQSLSLNERRMLDRIELELAHRWQTDGRNRNGDLAVTHRNFAAAGIRKDSIKTLLDGLESKKLIEVTERGCWDEGKDRRPSRYRLTYIDTADAAYATEWLDWLPAKKATTTRNLPSSKGKGRPKNRTSANGASVQ
jgi:hypothetical protein